MIHRTLLPAACLLVALIVALSFESVYRVSIQPRPADPLAASPATGDRSPLRLRLVDSGGVGIPLDAWGRDYSHDRRVFRRAILDRPPYVDEAEFSRIERDWRSHVERMLEYGNNAIVVPLLLELINFDRVPPGTSMGGAGVYGPDSAFRARHLAMRRYFGRLFEWTERRGMQVFLEADMPSVTPPLSDYLRRLAPGAGPVGIDASDPAPWAVYRAGLEEVFDALPSVKGVVIRFGEGGNLYNTAGWPYRSEMGVRSAASLQTMLLSIVR